MFKAGDVVRVKKYKIIKDIPYDGLTFAPEMIPFCNTKQIIEKVTHHGNFVLSNNRWRWKPSWLEKYDDKFEEHKKRLLNV